MMFSDDFSQFDQAFQEAGASGQQLRFLLLRHVGELLQHLTCNLELDTPSSSEQEAPASFEETKGVSGNGADSPVVDGVPLALPEYGDESSLHEVRMEALRIFDTRRFDEEEIVVVWLAVFQLWGRPLLICKAVMVEGNRGIRHWLPPEPRRAQLALLFLEMETRMRRLPHASYLSPMRSALFAESHASAECEASHT